MNSKEISRFIGRHPRLRKVGYQLIYLTTLREWYIARAVRQIMSAKPEILSALDAGCGMGQHTYSLARKRPELLIAAIEEDREQVEVLSDFFERCGFGRVRVRAGDITRAELGMPVDLLLCCSVLEHIQDDITLLKRFHAQLRDEGNFVIYVPLAERRVLKSLERKIALMTKTAGISCRMVMSDTIHRSSSSRGLKSAALPSAIVNSVMDPAAGWPMIS